MPKHRVTLILRPCLLWAFFCLPFENIFGQTAITTLNTTTQSASSSTTLVTSPSDASNSISPNTQYNINYGGGNDVFITDYVIGGTTYDNFLQPDSLVIRRTDGSRFINIWYSLTNIDTGPNPDELNLVPTKVDEADAIYQAGLLNGGYDNILVNNDDLAGASIQAQTERVDLIWYSGIRTSDPTTAVFPVIERGGNDNIKVAAITSLDGNGDPSGYTSMVTISSGAWTGGTVSVGTQLILRRQVVGQDPIPILNNGSQNVEGVAVSFNDLGITANQVVYGYSIFASDVNPDSPDFHDLVDFNTFPNTTLSSVSGLDLVAGLAAAVASDDELIENVGPGGFKSALSTWLKANEGVTSSASDGDLVTLWEDQAIGNHDFTNLGTAPTYRSTSSTINFNPTIDFLNGSETGLQVPDNEDFNVKSVNDGYTNKGLNIAFRTSSNITTKQQLYEQGGGTNGLGLYISGGSIHLSVWNRGSQAQGDWNDNASNIETVSASVATDTEYIITMEFEGDAASSGSGRIEGFLNGASIGSLTTPHSQNIGLLYNHGGDIGLGQHDGASAYHDNYTEGDSFYGEISEFIYCNEPANFALATRQRIESYLAIKYGITLDQSSPYNYVNSGGSTIFNTTDAASIGGYLEYNDDIAGIGRDDDSELIQLQSRSENSGSIVTMEKTGGFAQDDTWLIWGNDQASTAETSLLTMPDTIDMRISRVWRVAEEDNAGAVSVSFDLNELGLTGKTASELSLLIAGTSSNADFSSATVLTGGIIAGTTITFSGVTFADGEYFTLGTDFAICSPGGVETDLALWYKADAGTNTTVDGADVTSWADQSINGNNASENNGGGIPEEPTFRQGVANYNPAIRFTDPGGTTYSYLRSTSNPATDDMTLVGVFSTTQSEGSSDFWESPQIIGGDEGTVNGATASLGLSTGNIFGKIKADDNINNSVVSSSTYNDGQMRIGTVTRVRGASGALELYVDSENVDSGTSDNNQTNLSLAVGIGNSDAEFADAQFAGDIPEVIVFADDLDSDELNRVESYLAIRYGITRNGVNDGGTVSIDERDYRRSDGTAIWDYSVRTSTYYHDIAGIGRDDQSCYQQLQSSSVNSDGIVSMGLGTIAANNASNPNSFATDGAFLVWGDDDASISFAGRTTGVTGIGNVTERVTRIWHVQETETVGATDIWFDLTGQGFGTTLSDYQLIVSDDSGLGTPTLYQASSIDGSVVKFSGIDLTNDQYFTLGTARELCGPGGVTGNMRIWLRANAGTNTTTNGSDVTSWSDQSGFSNNATATNAPEFNDNNHNFNPSVDFTSANSDVMQIADAANDSPDQQAVFLVGTINSGSASWSPFIMKTASYDWPNGWGLTRNNSNAEIYFHKDSYTDNNSGADYASASISYDVPNVHIAYKDATTYFYSLDLGTPDSDTPNSAYLSSDNVTFLGATPGGTGTTNNTTPQNFLEGSISEVIMFEDDLTAAERERIASYLAVKYGITLDNGAGGTAGDYTRADGTIIWDASDYATYHNDVAGIGRDDDGCFSQKQSHSVNTDDILTVGLGSVASTNALNVNSFDDDGDYFMWGNDDGGTGIGSVNTSDVPSTVAQRMQRVWRVNDEGTVGDTELQFDLATLGYSSNAEDFRLIVSNTSTMADGTLIAGGTFNGDVLSFSGINLTDGQYFTLATALETCGPGGVNSNIEIWMRADLEVYSDAGTTLATDGQDVQQWDDQSSPARDGSETDLGGGTPVEPTYDTAQINFNPVVSFIDPNSTNSSYIETSTFTPVGNDMTMISVFRSGQDQGSSGDFVNTPALIGGSETSSSNDFGLGFFEGQVIINANTTDVFDATTTGTYNDNQPHIALATRDQSTGNVEIFMTGQTDATGTGSTATLNGASSLGIGNHSDGDVQAQYNGDIAETIVFSSVLTGEEQSRVETYLALKYGLTLSNNRDGDGTPNEIIEANGAGTADDVNEGDYVAGDGGIIWDYDDQGATYYNDIFGIGRDDISCFEQQKSKSENSDAMVTFDLNGSFSADDSWLISGNDNAPVEAIDNNERPASINSRLNREWRVQETGTVGTIRLTYDISSITGTPTGDNNLNLVRLMVDDDGDFRSGVTLIAPNSIDGGAKTVTFEVDFTDGQYYTLGSIESNALPITLISFEAKANENNQVEVIWATAEEIDNSFFTIERSVDGINFEAVGFEEGAGNSSTILEYSFVDYEPLEGISYYRLKQTDFNGEFDYSEVSRVAVYTEESIIHKVVPNPVTRGENFRVIYPVETEQNVRVSIANANGITTYNQIVRVQPEDGEIVVNTSRLSKGLYFIQIIDQNLQNITLKFIVN